MKEKSIAAKRAAAEAGAVTRVRVKYKAEVRDRDMGILTEVLKTVKSASNGLKRAMVGSEEETKEKAERSRAKVEAEETAAKVEEEAALQDMIQARVEYWESQERDMIEEYDREKAEAETEAEYMMREKVEVIERVRAEDEAKERSKDDTRKQVWREKSLSLRNSKNNEAEARRVKPETKIAVIEAQ